MLHSKTTLFTVTLVACGARSDLTEGPVAPDASAASETSAVDVFGAADTNDGADAQLPVCTATARKELFGSNDFLGEVAVGDGFVYTLDNMGTLQRVAKSGGLPTTLGMVDIEAAPELQAFALDANYLYYESKTAGTLVRLPTAGGVEEPLGVSVTNGAVTLAGTTLYVWPFGGAPDLHRIPITGGTDAVLANSLEPLTSSLVVDGSFAFIGGYTAGLFALDLGTAALVQLSHVTAFQLVVDDAYVYMTTGDNGPSGSNQVLRISKTDGTTLILATAKFANGLVLQGSYVYYTDTIEGIVRRVNKQGSASEVIVPDKQLFPVAAGRSAGIAADDRCIYWTNVGGLFAVEKPN